jgi:hypothetical protein
MHLGEPWGVNYVLPIISYQFSLNNVLLSKLSCRLFSSGISCQCIIVNVVWFVFVKKWAKHKLGETSGTLGSLGDLGGKLGEPCGALGEP